MHQPQNDILLNSIKESKDIKIYLLNHLITLKNQNWMRKWEFFSSVWRKARSKKRKNSFAFYSIRDKWLSVYFLCCCCFYFFFLTANDKNKLLMCLKKQKGTKKKVYNFKVNWHAWWSLFRVHTTVNIHLLCLHFTFNAFSTFTFHHHVFIEIILLMWKHAWWHGSCTFISTPTHIHFTSSILIVELDGMLILTYTEKKTHSIVVVLPFIHSNVCC